LRPVVNGKLLRCPNYQRFAIDLPEIHRNIYISFNVSLANLW